MHIHCFSVDVEGFCEGMAESFSVPAETIRTNSEKEEIKSNVDEILEFLDLHNVKGTFFILGIIGEEQPELVRRISDSGHEIGSHCFEHLRLYNMASEKVREAITRSKKVLEDASGRPVFGFRAPDFSISEKTRFILDYIVQAGYLYDSSIYPVSWHDVYGIRNAKREIHVLSNKLVEFPPATYKLFGMIIPALGGGYFRLMPLCLSKHAINSMEKEGNPAMFYIHPYEIGSQYPIIRNLSLIRKFRHYVNMNKSREKFARLFKKYTFGRAIDILKSKNII